MRLRTKVAILAVAVFLTFAGFNIMASPFVLDFAKAINETGPETHSHIMAKVETVVHHSNLI